MFDARFLSEEGSYRFSVSLEICLNGNISKRQSPFWGMSSLMKALCLVRQCEEKKVTLDVFFFLFWRVYQTQPT